MRQTPSNHELNQTTWQKEDIPSDFTPHQKHQRTPYHSGIASTICTNKLMGTTNKKDAPKGSNSQQ
jgi:hypothetical protein